MKISDAKKEIEITVVGIRTERSSPVAEFVMEITRPVQAKARFEASDIATEQGKTGVRFRPQSRIADAFKAKGNQSVLITLPANVLQWIRDEDKAYIATRKAEAAAQNAKVWYWTIEGEYYMLSIFPGLDWDTRKLRPDLKEMEDILEKNQMKILDELRANSKEASHQDWMRDNTTWMEIDADIIEGMARKIIAERNAAIQARKDEKESKEKAAIQKAEETGEKQVIRQWTEPCDDPDEECDIDGVIEFAYPDGHIGTERHHTW